MNIEEVLKTVENGMAGWSEADTLKRYIKELQDAVKERQDAIQDLQNENDRLVEILQSWEKE